MSRASVSTDYYPTPWTEIEVRVLLVSQDADVRLRAAGGLQARQDVEVVEATSAAEAHRIVTDDHAIDVIVMDGDMRPEGGYSVIYEMRAHAQLEGVTMTPVVVLIDRSQDRWLAHWAGAQHAMLKPVNPFVLAERVVSIHEETSGQVTAETPGSTVGREMEMADPPEVQDA